MSVISHTTAAPLGDSSLPTPRRSPLSICPPSPLPSFFGTCWLLVLIAAADKSILFDEEALHYLALSAESHLRTLLTSTLSAQIHRTTSTHTRPAPIRNGKPMWSHTATSDPLALMQAMNAQLKAGEQAFRQDRMHRIQKEKDVAARTISLPIGAGSDGSAPSIPGTPGPSGGFAPGPSSGSTTSAMAPSTPGPVFGATPKPKKSTAKKKEHSTEAQHKMSNQTAMRQAFGTKKQYSWMQTMPSQPSPLGNKGGKKRKHALANVDTGAGSGGGGDGDGDGDDGEEGVKREQDPSGQGMPATPGSGAATPNRDGLGRSRANTPAPGGSGSGPMGKRIKLTEPTRRQVVVSVSAGVEKTVSDDRAITIKDALFVLDRDRAGRGMGWGEAEHDDLIRRAWTLGEGVVTAAAMAAATRAEAAAAAAKRAIESKP